MKKIITRFAPSPTGFLHIGGVRTALINYIITSQAKNNNPESKFFLRIEDTDRNRSDEKFIKSIIKGLEWMGIDWDDDIEIQSKNINDHRKIALELLTKNLAFKCICKPEALEELRLNNKNKGINLKRLCNKCENDENIQSLKKDYAIRVKIPLDGSIIINDIIQGKVKVENNEIDNFVILRKDGTPTYMLSVVVDDFNKKVNLVIRGADHLNNTFRQLYIYKHMNWPLPEYAHLPLIHGEDGSKLSKRHGAVDINEFREIGYLKESILNNLILLGWAPGNNDEIIEMKDIIKIFNLKKLSKSSSIFSYEKLNHFNNLYLRNKDAKNVLSDYFKENEILFSLYAKDEEKMNKIFEIHKKDISFLKELETISKIYFDNESKNHYLNLNENKNFHNLLGDFMQIADNMKSWDHNSIGELTKNFVKSKNINFKEFGKPMRILLINKENGPSINDILFILGKKDSIIRIKKCIENSL